MELLKFIDRTPTAFHASANVSEILKNNGYTELFECDSWNLEKGGKYFTVRNLSSLIAFQLPENDYTSFMACASHTDSPCFKIKSSQELAGPGEAIRLNVEGYGGMIRESWFDRPLSVAGRIAVLHGNMIEYKLVNVERDLMIIPSLAIHMGSPRSEDKVNIQNELLPVLRSDKTKTEFIQIIAENANVNAEDIAGCDLFVYNRMKGTVFGAENEFISSGRIDNLENVFISLNAFIKSEPTQALKIFAAFDNEETGSLTKQGAQSTFFTDVLERINAALGVSKAEFLRRAASSFILSSDNAHATHPNYPGKADPCNSPMINGGVVLKFNASGRYTTDGVSAAAIKAIAKSCGVPLQVYHNRSDMPGGSTLGNLMNVNISVYSADIGLAQLAMHSAYETAGAKDVSYMEAFIKQFYETELKTVSPNRIEIKQKHKNDRDVLNADNI